MIFKYKIYQIKRNTAYSQMFLGDRLDKVLKNGLRPNISVYECVANGTTTTFNKNARNKDMLDVAYNHYDQWIKEKMRSDEEYIKVPGHPIFPGDVFFVCTEKDNGEGKMVKVGGYFYYNGDDMYVPIKDFKVEDENTEYLAKKKMKRRKIATETAMSNSVNEGVVD